MKVSTVAAITALAAGNTVSAKGGNKGGGSYNWYQAPYRNIVPYSSSDCSDSQTKGWDFKDLKEGGFNDYQGFQWSGFSCGSQGKSSRIKRSPLMRRGDDQISYSSDSKHVSCTIKSNDYSGSFKYDKGFNVDSFYVSADRDVTVEANYQMPDGSECRKVTRCAKGGARIDNDQCGGAKQCRFRVHHSDDKKTDCQFNIHKVKFHCGAAKEKPPGYAQPGYSPPANQGSYAPPADQGSYAPPADQGSYTPPKDQGSYAPPTDQGSYAPPKDQGSYTPPKDQGSYAPPADQGSYAPPADQGSYAPPKDQGSYAPPKDQGSYAPPKDQGSYAPPKDQGSYAPPADQGSYAPPADQGSYAPPKDQGSYAPPADQGSYTPPKDQGSYAPPKDQGSYAPPKDQGSYAPPTDQGSYAPPADQGSYSPPADQGSYAPPSDQGNYGPPSKEGSYAPPSSGCPDVLPQCVKSWMYIAPSCADSYDTDCYCPNQDYTNKVYDCVQAYASSDDDAGKAIQNFQGMCSGHIGKNPGLITHYPPYIPMPKPEGYVTTITVSQTVDYSPYGVAPTYNTGYAKPTPTCIESQYVVPYVKYAQTAEYGAGLVPNSYSPQETYTPPPMTYAPPPPSYAPVPAPESYPTDSPAPSGSEAPAPVYGSEGAPPPTQPPAQSYGGSQPTEGASQPAYGAAPTYGASAEAPNASAAPSGPPAFVGGAGVVLPVRSFVLAAVFGVAGFFMIL